MNDSMPDGFRCAPGGDTLAGRLYARWPKQAVDHAMLLVDAHRRIVAVNDAAETMFAAQPGGLLGLPLSELFTEHDRALALDRQEFAVAERLGASEDDRWHLRRDGTEFWSQGVLRTILGETGALEGFAKVIRDRTDLRAQMDTTANRLAAAEAALALRKRQLATAGHELRGPLGTISNAVHALRQRDLPEEKSARLQEIVSRQMEIASRLLRDTIESSAEDLEGALEVRDAVLQDILADAVDAVRATPVAVDRTIELIVPEAPLAMTTDPVRVEQVIRNLLENGCKYTAPGGRVWVTATVEGDDAVVRVRDDGAGIANDLLPRLFDWFVRGDDAMASGVDGFGIGLGVVRDVVHRLHGSVEVVSAGVHAGSEFTVNLPVRQPPSDA